MTMLPCRFYGSGAIPVLWWLSFELWFIVWFYRLKVVLRNSFHSFMEHNIFNGFLHSSYTWFIVWFYLLKVVLRNSFHSFMEHNIFNGFLHSSYCADIWPHSAYWAVSSHCVDSCPCSNHGFNTSALLHEYMRARVIWYLDQNCISM